jgi:[ribosomal protein S18]-alanine N-acetyltransferase
MDSEFLIRKVSKSDIPEILLIENESFGNEAFSQNQFIRHLKSKNSFFFAAVSKSRITGYVILLKRSNGKYLRIYSIAVEKKSRGKHVGRLLINLSEKIATEEKKAGLSLEVSTENQGAVAFYINHNFLVVGRIPGYYNDGSDALKMIRYL